MLVSIYPEPQIEFNIIINKLEVKSKEINVPIAFPFSLVFFYLVYPLVNQILCCYMQ